MSNVALRSKLFGGRPLYDLVFDVFAETTQPYTTTLPSDAPRNANRATELPEMDGKPYIRAPQAKQVHRYEIAALAAGPAFEWVNLTAVLQTYQGGFISRTAETRLVDRDLLQTKNPVVFLHGAGNLGGALRFGHYKPRQAVNMKAIPVIRTNSTEQQAYILSPEGSAELTTMQNKHRERRPYTNAQTARARRTPAEAVLLSLWNALMDDGREEDALEVKGFAASSPTDRQADKWLEDKKAKYKKEMEQEKIPNVEIRQALKGYYVIPAGTVLDERNSALGITDFHAGLAVLGLYRRNPTLGGRAAVGCGAYLRQVYRVSVSDTVSPPTFDCLVKVEPFQPLAICREDAKLDDWSNLASLPWQYLDTKGLDCFVTHAIAAWHGLDRREFDFNFVPRGASVPQEDDDSAAGEL